MPAAFARKIIGLIATAYLLYLIAVALIMVPAANGLLPTLFQQQTGRTLQFRSITINPFTLSVTLNDVRNDNPDGTLFFAASELHADVSLRSLWHGLTLDELRVAGLQLHVAQTDTTRYNFSDIIDFRQRHLPQTAPAPTTDNSADGSIMPLTIQRAHIDTGAVSLRALHQPTPIVVNVDHLALDIDALTTRDTPTTTNTETLPPVALRRLQLTTARVDVELPGQQQPFKTHIADLQAGLELFSTRDPEAQPFTLALVDESGGSVSATGEFSLASAQSRGNVDIKRLSLLPATRYLADQLFADYNSGALSLDGSFAVDWKAPAAAKKTTPSYRVDLRRTEIANVSAHSRDDADTHARLGALVLQNTRIDSSSRNVQIDSATVDALQVRGWNREQRVSLLDMFRTNFVGSEEQSAPWSLELKNFALGSSSQDNSAQGQCRIDWRTDSIDQEKLSIAPLQLSASNLHWPAAQPAAIAATATINDNTQLTLKGSLVPATRTGTLDGELKGLPLTWGNRLLAQQLTAQISRGTLDTQFAATLDQGTPTQIRAQGAIADFQLLRNSNKAQVAAWQRLRWQELNVDIPQQRVQIKQIDFDKPEMRFRINPDGTTNLQELAITKPAEKIARAAEPSTERSSERSPQRTPQLTPQKVAADTPAQPWRTDVDRIHIQGGTLDFRDNSLPRPFRALIGDFTGDITGLSSAPEKFARVDLQGSVDGYAPVALTGTIAPLRTQPALDLALDFTNLDLATLTAYSGTYAGYAINRGLLTLQLNYKLEDHRLQGQNRIVITQLELGEKVASPKAVDLPLRLAIALLTDENGVIDLGVGVEGDLDNPEFSVRGIIWKALRNVIVKAVTSPFRLLASLAGGGEEELGVVDFDAGTDHITPASRERLGTLVQALAKRPTLQVRVIGHADAVADATEMKQGKLDYFLEQAGASDEDRQARNSNWAKAVTKLYKETFPDNKVGEQTPDQLAIALRDNMTLGADAMDFIAARRALAVKRALVVELGLATDRVLIDSAPANKSGSNRTQAELKLDT